MARLAIDWGRLRLALGLTQADLGEVLGIRGARDDRARRVRKIERGERPAQPTAVARLALYLMLEGPRERLARAGVPHPFADVVADALALWRRSTERNPPGPARACPVCGDVLGLHARCARCPQLLGDAHAQPVLADGLCRSCRARARARYDPRKSDQGARKSA